MLFLGNVPAIDRVFDSCYSTHIDSKEQQMISADTIRRCAYLHSNALEAALRMSYPKDSVLRSEFLGISNGEQFVYKIVYPDEDAKTGMAVTKVFVWENSKGELVADY
jgi:lambda repressor-like predicted transcriptional regulator